MSSVAPEAPALVLAGAEEFLTTEALEVGGDVLQRLGGGVGVDDARLGPLQEDKGVQHRQQQRVDAQLRRDQREDGRPVGGVVLVLGDVGHARSS